MVAPHVKRRREARAAAEDAARLARLEKEATLVKDVPQKEATLVKDVPQKEAVVEEKAPAPKKPRARRSSTKKSK